MPGQKGNKGNRKSTSTKPKQQTSKDHRLSEHRSPKFQGGKETKSHGAPTNSHKTGTRVRKD